MRVLLVEDDAATAASIELMLRKESFICDTTDLGDGTQQLLAALEKRPNEKRSQTGLCWNRIGAPHLVNLIAQAVDVDPQLIAQRLELGEIALALGELPLLRAVQAVARTHAIFPDLDGARCRRPADNRGISCQSFSLDAKIRLSEQNRPDAINRG